MMHHSSNIVLALTVALLLSTVLCTEDTHEYEPNESIIVWANKIGPANNPQETYGYYTLPWCKSKLDKKPEQLGEKLMGNELVNTGLDIRFKVDIDRVEHCTLTLDQKKKSKFEHVIADRFWYQMYMDDLPLWGMVGEIEEEVTATRTNRRHLLYTHRAFSISYNGNRIIEVNLTSQNPVEMAVGSPIPMTYSVKWEETALPYSKRFYKYLDYTFFEHQIHWFSIFNSFMMVVFLMGLVVLILLRTVKKDFARYSRSEDFEEAVTEEHDDRGWKNIVGDVFRAPVNPEMFSVVVGTGAQLGLMALLVILFMLSGTHYGERGFVLSILLFLYSCSSIFGGMVSGALCARLGCKRWKRVMVATAAVFPSIVFITSMTLNFIALSYHSIGIPFSSIMVVFVVWFFASCLNLVGTLFGRHLYGIAKHRRVNVVPRPIPDKPWYMETPVLMALSGLLPFGSIFVEMYFLLTSVWYYKIYYIYGFLLLVFIILLAVVTCVSVVSTYFLLNSEEHRWQWTSFLCGSSSAIYVLLYCSYYFFYKTNMEGTLQISFYFGYSSLFCLALGLMTGAVGYGGAALFVSTIYDNIKTD